MESDCRPVLPRLRREAPVESPFGTDRSVCVNQGLQRGQHRLPQLQNGRPTNGRDLSQRPSAVARFPNLQMRQSVRVTLGSWRNQVKKLLLTLTAGAAIFAAAPAAAQYAYGTSYAD